MFCSTIIPTIGRASLARAVESVLTQEFSADEFEVIVVNDSAQPLAAAGWMQSPRVRVLTTQRDPVPRTGPTPKRTTGIARNTGAAVARGQYLHFLDDDDWLLPGAMQAWASIADAGAVWLFGGWQSVDDGGNLIREFTPKLRGNILAYWVAGENVPLTSSLVRADVFDAVGGFDPEIWTTEDRALCGRIALHGDVVGTTQVIGCVRVGEQSSSTRGNWHHKPEMARLGREKVLNDPSAFARINAIPLSPYWRGRLTRTLGNSFAWNLRRAHLRSAAQRATAVVGIAAPAFWQQRFWDGLRLGLGGHKINSLIPNSAQDSRTNKTR